MTDSLPDNLVAQSWQGPLSPPNVVPDSADVVIIGGGIIGISTAWMLAQAGVRVVLCEKGYIAGEQSGRNWGWVRQQGRDTREMPMIVESLRLWRGLSEAIGEDVGFEEQGVLFAAKSDDEIEQYHDWMKQTEDYGIGTRFIDGDELRQRVQGGAANWKGALFTPSDGRAEPHKATAAIARAAQRHGATLLSSCAVRGVETQGGHVSAVVTEHGRIATSSVLCAAGAWTSMFCRSLGIRLPQLKVRGTVARTAPAPNVFDGSIYDDRLAIRRRQDGGYTVANGLIADFPMTPATFRFGHKFLRAWLMDVKNVRLTLGREFVEEFKTPKTWSLDQPSPFEKTRVLNPTPNPRMLRSIRKHLGEMYPALANVELAETWAGMIETTPDVIPVIDEAATLPGFYVATGFSGHGFGIGPGAAKAIAGLITGDGSGLDLHAFRLNRFYDGTPIRPQSSV